MLSYLQSSSSPATATTATTGTAAFAAALGLGSDYLSSSTSVPTSDETESPFSFGPFIDSVVTIYLALLQSRLALRFAPCTSRIRSLRLAFT